MQLGLWKVFGARASGGSEFVQGGGAGRAGRAGRQGRQARQGRQGRQAGQAVKAGQAGHEKAQWRGISRESVSKSVRQIRGISKI